MRRYSSLPSFGGDDMPGHVKADDLVVRRQLRRIEQRAVLARVAAGVQTYSKGWPVPAVS